MIRPRVIAALLVLSVTAACAMQPAVEPALERPEVRSASSASSREIGFFKKKRAMRHVRKLADDIGVRVRGSSGERQAARYVKGAFESLGYKARISKFDVGVDGTSRNVIAWWPGARRLGVVIGGHMDTVPSAPGANDNASGVAVILETARIAAGSDQAKWLRFVAFGAEEYGSDNTHHLGSQNYVDRLNDDERERQAGMISVDMVADGRPLIVGTAGIGPELLAQKLWGILKNAGIGTSYRTTCDCSDNGPFERAGIPAAFMWSGDEPNYHLPSDTPENMSPKDLLRSGRAVRAFVKKVDQQMIKRLRKA